MFSFDIFDQDGSTKRVAGKLTASGHAATSLEPVLLRIATDMMKAEASLFHSQGRRGGGGWKKLKESTAKRKGHSTILIDSGKLMESLTQPGAEDQVLVVTEQELLFGTDDPVAELHQFGLGNNPRRPVLRFTPSDFDKWNRWMGEYITRMFKVK